MAQQYISVKVSGNQISSTGFVSLLLYNNPDIDIPDKGYVGFDNCSYFYTITTSESQNIFKLVKNNVRSSGAIRPGNLVIAFSIPKHYKLDGGYTPYDVLGELKDEFLKKCMTLKDAIRDAYEFNPGRIDQHVLDEVASKFTISPSQTPNRIMNTTAPKGYIVRSDAEIEKLFHDINYPEFDNYSEVIVAESASQTSYTLINNIQIPRPKSYKIYVDGVLNMVCADITQTLTVSTNSSPEYYENKDVHFTIQNLKDGDIFPGIELQDVNEKVLISTQGWATPKTRRIELKIVPREFENYFLTNRNLLKVTYPYGIIRIDKDMSFTIEGEQIAEIKKGTINVSLEQNDKFTLSKYAISGNELRITIEEIKQQQEKVTDLQIIKSSPVYDVSILLKGKDKFEKSNEIEVKLKTYSEESKLTTIETCFTRFKPQLKSDEMFEGHFYVPKEPPYPHHLYLCFLINGKRYRTNSPLSLSFSNEKTVVEERDFVISNVKPFYKKKSFLFKLLIPFIAILFGFIIGFASHDGIKSLYRGTNPGSYTQDTLYGGGGTSMTEEQAVYFLRNADDVLKSKDLKFSKVEDIYNKYIESKTIIDDVDKKQFDNKVCARIIDYNTVISYVTNGNVDELKRALDLYSQNDLHVWAIHVELLKQIVNDETTKELFLNNYSSISAFDEISSAITPQSIHAIFNCEVCDNVFETDVKLAEHKKSHSKTYACDKCSEVFDSKNMLQQHKSTAHSSRAAQPQHWDCEDCKKEGVQNYKFKTQEEYTNHKNKFH